MASSGSGDDIPLGDRPGPTDDPDWTDQVTELVVETVDTVRSRTTGPVLDTAHGAVYGIVAAIIVLPVLIALFVGSIRLLNWAIPGDVWIVYAIIAVVAWVPGALLWMRRERPDQLDAA